MSLGRLQLDAAGVAVVAADFALGVGMGTTASVSAVTATSNDTRGEVEVTSAGTGQAQATATVKLTFKRPFDTVPFVQCVRSGVDEAAATGVQVASVTKTDVTFILDVVPTATKKTRIQYLVYG